MGMSTAMPAIIIGTREDSIRIPNFFAAVTSGISLGFRFHRELGDPTKS